MYYDELNSKNGHLQQRPWVVATVITIPVDRDSHVPLLEGENKHGNKEVIHVTDEISNRKVRIEIV